jgi:hypothetical protein
VPLSILDHANLRVHADFFGPMITAGSNKKFELCITEAFTKYALVMAITSKDACYREGIIFKVRHPGSNPHGQWKEFINKLSAKLFQLLNVIQTKTSPVIHPSGSFK